MAYSDFTQATLETKFNLEFVQVQGLLEHESVTASDYLQQTIQRNLSLAIAINTEKARSELLIAPMLVELKEIYPQVSLFSGTEFNVDSSAGLNGFCDFLLSQSADQINIRAPVVALVEAKKEDLNQAIPQCVASMLAARIFNDRHQNNIPKIYGIITTGSIWRFLMLYERQIKIDLNEIYLKPLENLLGYLGATVRSQ
ncbi:MAG: hypothetical protein J7647_28450 [Cyanobacteria bacterium SBLK]|nr:hypothetical protein [Cyanobacteria bacterium SBLK]